MNENPVMTPCVENNVKPNLSIKLQIDLTLGKDYIFDWLLRSWNGNKTNLLDKKSFHVRRYIGP